MPTDPREPLFEGKTLPMSTDAPTILRMTIGYFMSRLNAEDREFLEKSMVLYGDLRVTEAVATDEPIGA